MLIPWNSLISKTRFLLSWSKEEEDLFRSCPGEWTRLECRQHHRRRGTNDLTNFCYCVRNSGPAPVSFVLYNPAGGLPEYDPPPHVLIFLQRSQTEAYWNYIMLKMFDNLWTFQRVLQDQDIWNTVICLFMINQISSFSFTLAEDKTTVAPSTTV